MPYDAEIAELTRRIEDLEALVRENMEERHPVLETGGLGVNALADEAVTSVALAGNPQLVGDVVLDVAGLVAGAQVGQTITFTGNAPSPYITDVSVEGGDPRPTTGGATLDLSAGAGIAVAWAGADPNMTVTISAAVSMPAPTAKGDSIWAKAANGSFAWDVLHVGADGKVLEADSTQALGVKWGTQTIVGNTPNSGTLQLTTTIGNGLSEVAACLDQQTLAKMTIINGGDIIGLAALLTNGEFFLWDPGG